MYRAELAGAAAGVSAGFAAEAIAAAVAASEINEITVEESSSRARIGDPPVSDDDNSYLRCITSRLAPGHGGAQPARRSGKREVGHIIGVSNRPIPLPRRRRLASGGSSSLRRRDYVGCSGMVEIAAPKPTTEREQRTALLGIIDPCGDG